jgi:dolichol-phosphate mannosyltransferase
VLQEQFTEVFLECPAGEFRIPSIAPQRKLSLIIPTFQEAGNLTAFLAEVSGILDRKLGSDYEIVVVDDDSPDGTWELAAAFSRKHPATRVIRRTGARGLASAVVRGYQAASGAILGTINADFQHPPAVLEQMIEKAAEADIVIASRFCCGASTGDWQKDRVALSRAAQFLGKLMLPDVFGRVTDPLSGCYLFGRRIMEGAVIRPAGFKTLIEVLARGNALRIAECPYQMRKRERGNSKASFSNLFQFVGQLSRLKAERGS